MKVNEGKRKKNYLLDQQSIFKHDSCCQVLKTFV